MYSDKCDCADARVCRIRMGREPQALKQLETVQMAAAKKVLRAGPAEKWINHRKVVPREPLRIWTRNLEALTLTLNCTRRKKSILKIGYFYFPIRSRVIGGNSRTSFFQHRFRHEIVVTDQGESWWRRS